MKRTIIFFEDNSTDSFYPLSLSHTTAELQCGILSLGDKWSIRIPHDEVRLLTRRYLAEHLRTSLSRRVNEFDASDADRFVLINPRFIANAETSDKIVAETGERAYFVNNEVAALTIASDSPLVNSLSDYVRSALSTGLNSGCYEFICDYARRLPQEEVKLHSVKYLWDIVHHNGSEIESDFQFLIPELSFSQMFDDSEIDEDALIYNVDDVYVGKDCRIDGQVVIDARSGPVYIGDKVVVSPHTRLEGPAYIGEGCQLVGGKIRSGCSFGPYCRIGGEVEDSIFHGYSNKYHDGFVGHAYVGEWVNLGAMTTNSDLKNNYGNIKVELPNGVIDTGLNKVGSLIGDHSKTGIGTLLTTGMVIGFGVNLFGGGLSGGRALPSLVWGGNDGFVEHRVDQAIATARAVFFRRGKELGVEAEELFKMISEQTTAHRRGFLKSGGQSQS